MHALTFILITKYGSTFKSNTFVSANFWIGQYLELGPKKAANSWAFKFYRTFSHRGIKGDLVWGSSRISKNSARRDTHDLCSEMAKQEYEILPEIKM